jgi:hypothetical protein
MNRRNYQDVASARANTVNLYLRFTAGTSGAIPSKPYTENMGFGTVTLSSTGVLSIALNDSWSSLIHADAQIIQSSESNATAFEATVKTNSVTSGTAPLVVVHMFAENASTHARELANMAIGDVFSLHLVVARSTQP